MYIATRCGDEELTYLRNMFLKLDGNNNGYVEASELLQSLKSKFSSENEVKKIISSIDVDMNGMINYTEFLAATLDQEKYLKDDKLQEAFNLFDKVKETN